MYFYQEVTDKQSQKASTCLCIAFIPALSINKIVRLACDKNQTSYDFLLKFFQFSPANPTKIVHPFHSLDQHPPIAELPLRLARGTAHRLAIVKPYLSACPLLFSFLVYIPPTYNQTPPLCISGCPLSLSRRSCGIHGTESEGGYTGTSVIEPESSLLSPVPFLRPVCGIINSSDTRAPARASPSSRGHRAPPRRARYKHRR